MCSACVAYGWQDRMKGKGTGKPRHKIDCEMKDLRELTQRIGKQLQSG